MTAKTAAVLPRQSVPALLRVVGESVPLAEVLGRAGGLPITLLGQPDHEPDDVAAVDLSLHVARTAQPDVPATGVAYSGLTPGQRRAFLEWANDPAAPAPPAYRRLYIANLEVHLLTDADLREQATARLVQLAAAPTWRNDPWCSHALHLALWLAQQGSQLAAWLRTGAADPTLFGISLGHLALLQTPLDAPLLGTLLEAWKLAPSVPAPDLLKLRLSSLAATLGAEPLAYGLAALSDEARAPRPWRTAHRGLRLALPQPDLRPVLEQPLRDMLAVATQPVPSPTEPADTDDAVADPGWNLILEFGHSRSEFFDDVLSLSRRLPGYSQILDENRRVVYRVTFRKAELRRFWRIWEYAQSWSSTRVYVNGQELEPWKVWPYSQYLQ